MNDHNGIYDRFIELLMAFCDYVLEADTIICTIAKDKRKQLIWKFEYRERIEFIPSPLMSILCLSLTFPPVFLPLSQVKVLLA